MTLGSLFDGIGGFPLVASWCGINTLWASEIEPGPMRITERHFPNMKQLGDITKINGADIDPVDIITFGSPCQDLSVAGKRAGLGGERSGLFSEAIRIIKEMRGATNGKYPTFAVWENVPGAFSSGGGRDFKCVIESFCQICEQELTVPMPKKWSHAGLVVGDHYSFGWRTVDAQFWGVPQRRKRIYAVMDFRGHRAKQILFEPESGRRNFVTGEPPWERFTRSAEESIGADDSAGL